MIQERNVLMEKLYPELKEFCREKYGLEFQVITVYVEYISQIITDTDHHACSVAMCYCKRSKFLLAEIP